MTGILVVLLRLLAGAFALFWLYCAAFNAVVAWRVFARKQQCGPSHLPLAGGWFALVCLLLWSMSDWLANGSRGFPLLRFLWVPLLLDFGCLPALVVWGIPVLLDGARDRGR